ncbi:MAG: BspA family leucine-rich repeat surface protein [Oscillospiraceae bacterium]|nr:BspA family leucine-rich repeat surface protein [Oscillospiraceae bacterium]
MKHKRKLTAAAVASTMLLCSVFPADPAIRPLFRSALTAYAAGSVTLDADGKTLLLNGAFTREQLDAFSENENVQKIEAKEGCILPEDCSELFSKKDDHWLNLAAVDLKAADFSKVKTMESMFNRYLFFSKSTDFTSIEFDHPDTSNVTNMCRMFSGCSALTELDLSGMDTSKVEDMSFMFENCSGLTSLDVSSFDTENLNWMQCMFSNCSNLTVLDLHHFDTSKVDYMNGTFRGCSKLKAVNLSSFDTSMVLDMRQMFMGCSALTELDLSSFDTSNVYAIGSYTGDPEYISSSDQFGDNGMFDGCSSLQTIYVSSLWNNEKIGDSGDMFRDCTALTGGSGTVYDAAHTDIGYARIDGGKDAPGYFTASNKCGKDLTWVYDPETKTLTISGTGAMYDYQEPAKTPWYNYREEIAHIVLPEGMTTIGTCAFAWMHAVTEITVPITVTSIGMSAFELCDELEYITILNYETEIADSGWTICNVTRPTEDGHKYLYKGVIQGIANSTAEKYAEKYGYRFKAISVKIFFDPDNGKDPVEYTEHMGGAAYMLPACKFDPPAEGMVFVGWDNGNGIEAPETLIIPRSDLYYKAVWGYQNLSVSFDANGGDGNMTPVNVTSENPFIFPACGFTAPEGTFFAGWMLGDKTYQPDDTVTITKDTVVTAKWAHHIYTVRYNPNGGTGEMSDKTVEAGSEFTLPKCGFAAPEDKKFAGWLVDETVYEPGDTITISGDTEIIAAWKDSMKKMRRGDLDNDGSSDTKDAALLARFVNGWEGIEIDLEAADLDKNGTVNTRDAMILARYVNGWEGYDIYFADTEE